MAALSLWKQGFLLRCPLCFGYFLWDTKRSFNGLGDSFSYEGLPIECKWKLQESRHVAKRHSVPHHQWSIISDSESGSVTVSMTETNTWVNSQNGASLGFGWGYSILRNGSWIDSVRMSYSGHWGNGTVNNQTRSFNVTVTVQTGDVLVPLFNITGPSTSYVVGCGISAFKIERYAALNAVEGLYNGAVTTTSSGASYKGEWIQIQYPYPLRLQSWVYTPRIGNRQTFLICASSDGVNWTTIYNQSTALTWSSNSQTFNIDNNLHYTHYRFICVSTTSYAYFDGYA